MTILENRVRVTKMDEGTTVDANIILDDVSLESMEPDFRIRHLGQKLLDCINANRRAMGMEKL